MSNFDAFDADFHALNLNCRNLYEIFWILYVLLFPLLFNHLATKGLLYLLFVLLLFKCFSRTASSCIVMCIALVHCRQMKRIQTKISTHSQIKKKPFENNAAAHNRKLYSLCVSQMRRTLFENDHSEFMQWMKIRCIEFQFDSNVLHQITMSTQWWLCQI